MKRAVVSIVALAFLVTGCTTADVEPEPTGTRTSSSSTHDTTPRPTPAAPSVAPTPTVEATPLALCTDECGHEGAPAAFLNDVSANLQPDWFDTYGYMEADGQSNFWLDMGYATCGMISSFTPEQVRANLEPNFNNPRWYGEGFTDQFIESAGATICA